MFYSFANRLGGFMPIRLDADAQAYVDAVENAGATPTIAQKKALSNFYTTGKDEGWYSSLKRILLPIWGVTLPNEICMVNKVAKATSYGGINHSNLGYVVGDGVNDYMLDSNNLDTLCTSTSLLLGYLAYVQQTGSVTAMGVRGVTNLGRSGVRTNNTNDTIAAYNLGSATEIFSNTDTTRTGIYTSSRTSSTSHSLRVRRSTGVTSFGTDADTSESPPPRPFAYLAENNNGGISAFSNGSFGSFFIGDGLSNTDADKFTAALKTLWESATGLTLP